MATRRSRAPADEVLLTAVRWAMAISVRAADELGDLSPVQLRALTVLQENSGVNLNDLAQVMGVTVSTTSRLDGLPAVGRERAEQFDGDVSAVPAGDQAHVGIAAHVEDLHIG